MLLISIAVAWAVNVVAVQVECPRPRPMGIMQPMGNELVEWFYDRDQVQTDIFGSGVEWRVLRAMSGVYRTYSEQSFRLNASATEKPKDSASSDVYKRERNPFFEWRAMVGRKPMTVRFEWTQFSNADNVVIGLDFSLPNTDIRGQQQWYILGASEDDQFLLVYVCGQQSDKHEPFQSGFIVSSFGSRTPRPVLRLFDRVLERSGLNLTVRDLPAVRRFLPSFPIPMLQVQPR